jgi:AcrR family transcriptional regulator
VAAARLLEETRDLDAISIRAVADAVGLSPPAIYRLFTDRSELIFEMCERRFRELDIVCEEAAAASPDPLQSLRLRGRAYVRFGLAHPEEYRIWFMSKPGITPQWTAERIMKGPVVTHLVQAVQVCLDAGVIRPADPTMVAFGLWSAVHGLTSLLITKPAFPWPEVDELIDHILSMLVVGLVPGREELTRRAVAAERASIARELHDVIAHNVSVMVVQAPGWSERFPAQRRPGRGAGVGHSGGSGRGRTAVAIDHPAPHRGVRETADAGHRAATARGTDQPGGRGSQAGVTRPF